jgi:hypothetical protein
VPVHIFPNPATNLLTVVFESLEFDLTLLDLTGRKIFERNSFPGTATLDVSGYEPGIFILKIVSGQKTLTRKIIISHN